MKRTRAAPVDEGFEPKRVAKSHTITVPRDLALRMGFCVALCEEELERGDPTVEVELPPCVLTSQSVFARALEAVRRMDSLLNASEQTRLVRLPFLAKALRVRFPSLFPRTKAAQVFEVLRFLQFDSYVLFDPTPLEEIHTCRGLTDDMVEHTTTIVDQIRSGHHALLSSSSAFLDNTRSTMCLDCIAEGVWRAIYKRYTEFSGNDDILRRMAPLLREFMLCEGDMARAGLRIGFRNLWVVMRANGPRMLYNLPQLATVIPFEPEFGNLLALLCLFGLNPDISESSTLHRWLWSDARVLKLILRMPHRHLGILAKISKHLPWATADASLLNRLMRIQDMRIADRTVSDSVVKKILIDLECGRRNPRVSLEERVNLFHAAVVTKDDRLKDAFTRVLIHCPFVEDDPRSTDSDFQELIAPTEYLYPDYDLWESLFRNTTPVFHTMKEAEFWRRYVIQPLLRHMTDTEQLLCLVTEPRLPFAVARRLAGMILEDRARFEATGISKFGQRPGTWINTDALLLRLCEIISSPTPRDDVASGMEEIAAGDPDARDPLLKRTLDFLHLIREGSRSSS